MDPVSAPRLGDLKQRMPAARRRRQLLEVSLDRFAARGFHDTSMEEIAEAAGVTKPVLYQHFSSKRGLFRELLDTVGQELLGEVTRRAAAEDHPYHQVLAGFRAYFRFVATRTNAFRLLFGSGARSNEEFADSVRSLEESMARTIAGFIVADIDDSHRELLGYAIVGLAEVAARRWVLAHGGDTSPPGATGGGERAGVAGRPDRGRVPEGAVAARAEAEVLALRLADLAWAGLRGLPGGASPRSATP